VWTELGGVVPGQNRADNRNDEAKDTEYHRVQHRTAGSKTSCDVTAEHAINSSIARRYQQRARFRRLAGWRKESHFVQNQISNERKGDADNNAGRYSTNTAKNLHRTVTVGRVKQVRQCLSRHVIGMAELADQYSHRDGDVQHTNHALKRGQHANLRINWNDITITNGRESDQAEVQQLIFPMFQ